MSVLPSWYSTALTKKNIVLRHRLFDLIFSGGAWFRRFHRIIFALRSKNVIKIRQRTRELEDEFSSALFQLGNRLGDGIPAEIAFARVAENMRGTVSGDFFALAEKNITKLGMGLEQSLFDPKVGAVVTFPSNVIESSMKVLVESVRKEYGSPPKPCCPCPATSKRSTAWKNGRRI